MDQIINPASPNINPPPPASPPMPPPPPIAPPPSVTPPPPPETTAPPPVPPANPPPSSDTFVFKPEKAKKKLPPYKKVLLPAGITLILLLSVLITRNLASRKTQTQVPARVVTNCSTCRTYGLDDNMIGTGSFPVKPDAFTIETGRCKTYLAGTCEIRGSDCYCGYSLCQLFGAITPTPTPTTILTPSPTGAASPTTTTTPVVTATSTTTPIPTNTVPPGAFNFNSCPWCAYAIPKGTSCGISRTIVDSDAENVNAAIRAQRPGASPTYTPAQFASACTAYAGTRIREGVQGEYCGVCCQGSSGPGPGPNDPTVPPGQPTPTGVAGTCGCVALKVFNANNEEITLNQIAPGQSIKIAFNGGDHVWGIARFKVYIGSGTNLIDPSLCLTGQLIDGWCQTDNHFSKPGYSYFYVNYVPNVPGEYKVEAQACCQLAGYEHCVFQE